MFLVHSDIEVRSKYSCSLERLLGEYNLKRNRKPVMNSIKNSTFIELVEGIIERTTPFDSRTLNFDYPLLHDLNTLNLERRKTFYRVKRDLLLKLAKSIPGELTSPESGFPLSTLKNERFTISWDLSQDYSKEWVPDHVLKCIKMAKLLEVKKLSVVPKLDEIYR